MPIGEVRVIQSVECLDTELQTDALRKMKVLEYSKIHILKSQTHETVPTNIAVRIRPPGTTLLNPAVLNHLKMLGFGSDGSPMTNGRLEPPILEISRLVVTLNGLPLCRVTIPVVSSHRELHPGNEVRKLHCCRYGVRKF